MDAEVRHDGSLSDLGALGITQDPDVAQVVWDVGTWPPPRGPGAAEREEQD